MNNKRGNNQFNLKNNNSILNQTRTKMFGNEDFGFLAFADSNRRTSIQFKKQDEKETSWKQNELDPWEKMRMDEDILQETLFNNKFDTETREIFNPN